MSQQKYLTKALPLPNGKRKYIRATTPEELEKKVRQAQLEIGMGLNIGDNTTVSELAQLWFNTFKKGKVNACTEKIIASHLNLHIVPIIGGMKVRDVKPVHIQMVMNAMSATSKSTSYHKAILAHLQNIFDLGVENGLLLRSPITKSVDPGGAKPAERVPLSDEEVAKLLDMMPSRCCNSDTVLRLMLQCGLRLGELLGLRWEDVDTENGYINVVNQRNRAYRFELIDHTKTEAGQRRIPLTEELWGLLKMEKDAAKGDYVVHDKDGQPVLDSAIISLMNRSSRVLGRHVHAHLLRHTCITNWVRSGRFTPEEVQYLAGHSNVSITLNIYTHYRAETRLLETAQKLRA